jgi:hypothetical protein
MNIVTRMPLPRRTFLRGTGALLALPWLECMSPRLGRTVAGAGPPAGPNGAPVAAPIRRFVGMMTDMGILPEYFFPTKAGRDYDSTPYLDILAAHRDRMTVLSGVSLPGVDGGHEAEKCFLTGAPGASRASFRNSVSLDQVMAEKVGADTRFPSLALMVGVGSLSLSWTRSGSMIPPITSPLTLYQQLFVEDTPEGKAASLRRLERDRSLLDGLREQYRALQQRVSIADRDRLEQFAAAVRDLEKNLAAGQAWIGRPKPAPSATPPAEIVDPHDFRRNARAMFDLVRLALETDSTRIVTVCLSTGDLTPTNIPGVTVGTHPLTHHGKVPEKIAELRRIEEAHFQALADFFAGLDQSREQGVSLLDHTACLYGTNMGSANAHSNDNLPVVLVGGRFQHAGHLAFDRGNNYPLTNLHVSLLRHCGIEADKFASSTGTFRGLELK